MQKIAAGCMALLMLTLILTGCRKTPGSGYSKYSDSFFDTFDTIVVVVAYTKSEDEFNAYFEKIRARFTELHRLYDIYHTYEGISNIKTINDYAGIKPVKVPKEIIDLLLFSREWYGRTEGRFNIALGPVLKIWHDYRERGRDDPENAKLPPLESLKKAQAYTDIDKVIVDTENSTVYLSEAGMSLDVGAVAKGFATEIVAREMMEEGLTSGIISAGGNVRVLGKPLDGIRESWGIALQDPDKPVLSNETNYLDVVYVNHASVVSSGDYERYYIVDDRRVHHLIDPVTLMPGDYYRAVSIVTESSALADVLSTAVFLMPYEKSRTFVESLPGVEALWVFKDGEIEITEGMAKILGSRGATSTNTTNDKTGTGDHR